MARGIDNGSNGRTRPDETMLEHETELDLIGRWQDRDDRRALDRLVAAYQPLVRKQARRFARYGLSAEDLLQEGSLALMEAVGRFDTTRGVRFSTYAIWWVRAGMQNYVLQNWSIVRLGSSRESKTLFFKLRYVQAQGGGVADGDGIARAAAALGAGRDAVARMDVMLRRGDLSLNATMPRSEADFLTVLPDDRPGPEGQAIAADSARVRARCIARALDALSPRERAVVRARCLTENAPTLRDLGLGLGVSTERVRQIEQTALAKMRGVLQRSDADRTALFDDGTAGGLAALGDPAGEAGAGAREPAYS